MADTPGWADNIERMYLGTLKAMGKLVKSPLAYVLTFGAFSVLDHVFDWGVVESVVSAVVSTADVILGGMGT